MSWKDKLVWADKTFHKASYKSATFHIESADTSVGRRNVVHQYPFKETPYVEDLGGDASEFTISGYVIQNTKNKFDYLAEKDALIKALKKSGSGVLVHPFFGRLTVCLQGKARIEESLVNGSGMAKFTMTFVETGANIYPTRTVDPKETINKSGEDYRFRIEDAFATCYAHDSLSEATIGEATLSMSGAMNRVLLSTHSPDTTIVDIKKGMNNVNDIISDMSTYIGEATDYITLATSLLDEPLRTLGMTAPYNVGNSLVLAYCALAHFGDTASEVSLSKYFNQLTPIIIDSLSSAKKARNQKVIVTLVRSKAIINATKVAAVMVYDSYDRSKYITSTIIDAMNFHLDDLGDQADDTSFSDYGLEYSVDEYIDGLQDLKHDFVEAMKIIGADLANVEEYTIPYSLHATIVLAYNKYKDLDREDEIIYHNYPIILNPFDMPTGQTIKLLSK